jgi:hypothetical protein
VNPKKQSLYTASIALAGVLMICFLGCQPKNLPTSPAGDLGPPWFEDVTEKTGLHFIHDAGPGGAYFLPEIIGSGAALFDCDNDGRLDIYLVQNGGPQSQAKNRLFHQKADGVFEDISAGSGLDVSGYGMGVAIADVNNDGWPDVLLTEYGGIRLFLNNGNRTFTEVTKEVGLDSIHWATSASFFDYDRDGWLDLVVVHYVDYQPANHCTGTNARPDYCHPSMFPGTATKLFHNLGRQANGKIAFEDVTVKAGLAQRPGPGLGVLCADFNGDGWPDIFVANDAKPNHLWINQKNGTFREEAVGRGCAFNAMGKSQGNMGIAFGDVDGDGMPDLFVTHLTEENNTLWKQGPIGLFTDRTLAAGLANSRWRGTGFGVVMADFAQRGCLDLALVNGRVSRLSGAKSENFRWEDYAERNLIFANDGEGHFRDVSPASPAFCGTPAIGRGLCAGDIFGAGRIDLLATYAHGPARLYRNVAPQAGHWVLVRAFAPQWNRDAYGATITVRASGKQFTYLVQPGSSYFCSNDPRAHFGLGNIDKVDSISVLWPDGVAEEFPGCAVDQRLTLRKGDGAGVRH